MSSSTNLCLQLFHRSVLFIQRNLVRLFTYVHKGYVQGFVLMHLLRPEIRARYHYIATVHNVTRHNDESPNRRAMTTDNTPHTTSSESTLRSAGKREVVRTVSTMEMERKMGGPWSQGDRVVRNGGYHGSSSGSRLEPRSGGYNYPNSYTNPMYTSIDVIVP